MVFRRFGIGAVAVAAVTLALLAVAQQAEAGGHGRVVRHAYNPAFDLFPQYYAPPAGTNLGAQMYVAPIPTPPLVGHTWITYQPLMPHEMLYRHGRTYYRKNPNGGWTRVSVGWH